MPVSYRCVWPCLWIFLSAVSFACLHFTAADGIYTFPNFKYHFPPGSSMGIFLALAIPLDLPNKSCYLAYNFEGIYLLPDNTTRYDYPPVIQRQARERKQTDKIDRKLVYDMIEAKIQSNGFAGKGCVLRTICEASHESMENNGVLGDLLHIIFTPSTSASETNLSNEYARAEQQGKLGHCSIYNKNCSVSFLNMVSWIGSGF